VPAGKYRWITLVSPDEPDGTELLLEPNEHPAAKEYQRRLVEDGIPATMFGVKDTEAEYRRLAELGVKFTMEPTKMGENTIAVFGDTCGNLIQIIDYRKSIGPAQSRYPSLMLPEPVRTVSSVSPAPIVPFMPR